MNGLSKYYIRKIIKCFSDEMTATETSLKLKINRNTVNKYYRIIREAIADYQIMQLQYQPTAKEASPEYYCSWNRNQGLTFDLFHGDSIFVLSVINEKIYVKEGDKVAIEAVLSTSEVAYDHNATDDSFECLRHNGHTLNPETMASPSKLNAQKLAIDSFFSYAKDKLTKFYGVKKQYTFLYLKELEFRFNNKGKDLSRLIWRILPHHSSIWAKTRRKRK